MNPIRLGIVGGGAMGEALLGGALRTGVTTPGAVIVADISEVRRTLIVERYGVRVVADSPAAVEGSDVVVVAVKPQDALALGVEVKGSLSNDHLIVSIMAGVTSSRLSEAFGTDQIVRAMPNTPGQIGEGITVWTCTEAVGELHREQAQAVLAAFGPEIFVSDEKYLDMATAVNGSGPGFVFLFIEAFIDAAVRIGLTRPMAQQLVVQTIRGSANYLEQTGRHPAQLRNEVTSPAGTTAAGLHQLERAGLRSAVAEAVSAAYERSRELGK